jgi:uncharacterized membrane protein
MELTDKEKSSLDRIARQKNLYLAFSFISVVIAVILLVYYGLLIKNINGLNFVVIILVLLAGRAHLRQYRSAVLLHKLKVWLERKDVYHETDAQ